MKYQIPYEELALIGLSRQMVDSMPDHVKSNLANGEITPIINVRRTMENGVTVEMPMKLRVEEGIDGKERLVTYPLNKELVNSMNLSEESFKKLKDGEVLLINDRYLQMDKDTKCVIEMTGKQLDVDRKIAEFEKVRDIELGLEQKNKIKEGKPVELDVGGEKVTVGLDLASKDHFKSLKGDFSDWDTRKKIEYDIAHPEYVGLVQTDENRWEQQMIIKEGENSKSLKEKPAQTKSSSLKL